jgi:hypothetical protein
MGHKKYLIKLEPMTTVRVLETSCVLKLAGEKRSHHMWEAASNMAYNVPFFLVFMSCIIPFP